MQPPDLTDDSHHQLINDFLQLKPEALTRGTEAIQALNSIAPVVYLPKLNIYAVTGYESVCDVARRTQDFSNRYATGQIRLKDNLEHF